MLRIADGVVDLEALRVTRDGHEPQALTPIEGRLLAYLVAQGQRVVPLDELMREVWEYAPGVRSRAPYVAIQRLRAKIEREPAEPRHLVSIRGSGYRLDVEADAPAAAPAPPAAPPAAPRRSFGRGPVLADLDAAWASGARLVTLLGPGGIGKTHVAREHVAARGGSVAWLLDARTLDDVIEAVAGPLPDAGSEERRLQRVGRVLRHRETGVLVLDNAEHLVPIVARAAAVWLDEAPELRLLVTSRHPLGLPGERLLSLGPLDEAAAVALMVDRARRVRWGYAPSEEDRTRLARLATSELDGLPLALELAGARLAVLTPQGLADRLGQRFRLLSGSRGEARWSSLRAALEWSWELLEPDERRALAQCTVFAGPFDVDAAESVLDVEGWVPDVLQRLVDHSLLQRAEGDGATFQLLESVRELGRDKLDQPDAIAARHRAWCLGAPTASRGNLRAALADAVRARAMGDAVALAVALDSLAQRAGVSSDRLEVLGAALSVVTPGNPGWVELTWRRGDALRSAGDLDEAERVLTEALEVAREPEARARVLTALLAVVAQRTDLDGFVARFDEALAAVRAVGDERREGILNHNLAILERERGSLARAEALSREAAAGFQRVGDVFLEVAALSNLAGTLGSAGRLDDALGVYARALDRARTHALRGWRSTLSLNLAHLRVRRGELDEALRGYAEALELALSRGDLEGAFLARHGRASALLDAGRLDEASEQLTALSRDRGGIPRWLGAFAVALEGIAARADGRLADAELLLRGVLDEARDGGFEWATTHCAVHLAALLAERGRPDEAEAMAAALAPGFAERGDDVGLSMLEVVRAEVALARGASSAEVDGRLAAVRSAGQDAARLIRLLERHR